MIKVISFLTILLMMSPNSFAGKSNIIAVVSGLKGKAFFSVGGKTMPLKEGMHLSSQAEVFTEVGSQVSINDYYDHIYHLSGAGHIILHRNLVELKEGYLWIKSLAFDELKGPLRISTANAIAVNKVGEAIVSFDSYSGKTQILTVKGDFIFRNSLNQVQYVGLTEGQFSFIQNEHEEGSPRRPTPIGYASYQKITGLFSDVEATDKTAMIKPKSVPTTKRSVAKRVPASQKTKYADPFARALGEAAPKPRLTPKNTKQGETIIIKLRSPASIKKNTDTLINYYHKKIKKLATPAPKRVWKMKNGQGRSNVPIVIYGSRASTATREKLSPKSSRKSSKRSKSRFPASIAPKSKVMKQRTPASARRMVPKVKNSAFERGLSRQYKKQKRHDTEVNDLIDQLKSVDMDYKKDY